MHKPMKVISFDLYTLKFTTSPPHKLISRKGQKECCIPLRRGKAFSLVHYGQKELKKQLNGVFWMGCNSMTALHFAVCRMTS